MQGIIDFWRTTSGKFAIISGGGVAGLLSICFACTVCSALIGSNDTTSEISSRPSRTPTSLSLTSAVSESQPTATPTEEVPTATPTKVISTETPTLLPSTEIPTAELLPTETPLPEALKPLVTAAETEVNLRGGPGTDYETVGTLPSDKSLEITGRNADSSWWQVSTQNGLAWVAAQVVVANNVVDTIPVVEAPPPPVQPAPTEQPPEPTSVPTIPPPAPTAVPVAPVEPAFTGKTVDPPWWPCMEGQIKGNRDSGKYHTSGGQFYDRTYEGVECFATEAEAQAAGYVKSQR